MSMNLYCREFEVRQIGTNDTNDILSLKKGQPEGGWQGVAKRLRAYWEQAAQEMLKDAKGNREEQNFIREDLAELNERLDEAIRKNPNGLHFGRS